MHVLLLIRELAYGGADRQLAQLAVGLARRSIPVTVAVFYSRPTDPLEQELARAGVTVVDLAKRGRFDVVPFLLRLHRLLSRTRPTAVYSFLPLGNLAALLARVSAPGATVAWGVRCSDLDGRVVPARERAILRLEAGLSRLPDLVVSNSHRGADDARARGFPPLKVIPNGIDTDRFRPPSSRPLRAAWGIPDETPLIGAVGKLSRMKDFDTFLRAAALLRRPEARFVWVGPGHPRTRGGARPARRGAGARRPRDARAGAVRRRGGLRRARFCWCSPPPSARASPTSSARPWRAAHLAWSPTSATRRWSSATPGWSSPSAHPGSSPPPGTRC
jgi:glycosyltransferase involved in cell wall biosynthesis